MEYCTFSPTWTSSQNFNFVSKYSLLQTTEEWYFFLDNSDSLTSTTTRVDNDLNAEGIPVSGSDILRLTSPTSDSGHCELTVTCKPHCNVTILGVSIVSEAKTVECYSKVDGYIASMRGDIVESERSNEDIEEDGGGGVLYHCHLKLAEQLAQISFKFMGLGDKTVTKLYKLKFVLLQGQEDNSLTRSRSGNIDLAKVKGYLHSMGDSVPDNALDLLQSMEQYQKNQMSSLQDVQDMFGGLNLGQGQTGNSGITGLLSMVSKLGPMKKAKPLSKDQNGTNHIDNAHDSMLDRLNVRMLPLERIARSVSESGGQGETEGDGRDVMYKMLQSICGSVSQMRDSEQAQKQEEDDGELKDNDVVPNCDNRNSRTDTQTKEPVATGMNSEELQMAIQQTVSQIFLSAEERLKNYIDTSLTALEERLSQKFEDMIQQLVHNRLSSDPS